MQNGTSQLPQPPEDRTAAVIVPVLNEREGLPALCQHLASLGFEQAIIVDGGSIDGSFAWLQEYWQDFGAGRLAAQSAPGRARQMNVGAAHAVTDQLVFLHADSRLPLAARQEVLAARERQNLWGRFDIAFSHTATGTQAQQRAMRVIAMFMNIRSRLSSIATGDQAIFVDHELFRNVGGYPSIPLMEDVAISKILKRHSVPHCSRLRVSTSPRRWEQAGVIRTVLQMWYYRLAFFLGMSPQRLAAKYRQVR
ncbi:MAG: TIGR04283 family arsenosugar biosynthesis glycosyltransferase [Pseudomonadota bacterium]